MIEGMKIYLAVHTKEHNFNIHKCFLYKPTCDQYIENWNKENPTIPLHLETYTICDQEGPKNLV